MTIGFIEAPTTFASTDSDEVISLLKPLGGKIQIFSESRLDSLDYLIPEIRAFIVTNRFETQTRPGSVSTHSLTGIFPQLWSHLNFPNLWRIKRLSETEARNSKASTLIFCVTLSS